MSVYSKSLLLLLSTLSWLGGDAETFREIQSSFHILKDLFLKEGKQSTFSFGRYLDTSTDGKADASIDGFEDILKEYQSGVASYDYYEAAAEEEVPLYRVEIAKSGRSQCAKVRQNIVTD